MIFTGTLLPQDESPLENQKSTLDLLKKINTVSELIPVQTESLAIITSDTLLGSNIRNVIVNTALTVSITIPDGLPMGTEIQITQVYDSTSQITLKSKGNDTIESAVSVSYGINISSLSIMKISKTNWSRVKGAGIIESYTDVTTGIHVEKRGDGTMVQWGSWLGSTGTAGTLSNWYGTTSGTTYYRRKTITFPEAFVGELPVISGSTIGVFVREAPSLSSVMLYIMYTADPVTPYCSWIAEGPWK